MRWAQPPPPARAVFRSKGEGREGATRLLCTLPTGWLPKDESRALGRVSPSEPTLGHVDGAKMESQEFSPTTQETVWQLRVRSPPWLSPFPPGGANSCGLLQSGKVVGVGLDLPAELAGQSGYSSAHSQGNPLSMWGEGEDKRGQISWPHGGCHWSWGYQRGLGPGPRLIGEVMDPARACNQLEVRAGPQSGGPSCPLAVEWPAS